MDATSTQRRRETENYTREQRSAESKKQYGPIDRDFIQPRHSIRYKSNQGILGQEKQTQSGCPAKERKKQTLGEKLLHQPWPGRSKRLANSHFTRSHAGASQHQIGHIHARDQQNQ